VTVVLADDHPLARAGLRRFLEHDKAGRFTVVGEASDGGEAIGLLTALAPQVAVLDLQMPIAGGREVVAWLKHSGLATRAVVVSGFCDSVQERDLLSAGAASVVEKTAEPKQFLAAVAAAGSQQPATDVRQAGGIPWKALHLVPTPRREKILRLLARGLSAREIAAQLGRSPRTVEAILATVQRQARLTRRELARVISGILASEA